MSQHIAFRFFFSFLVATIFVLVPAIGIAQDHPRAPETEMQLDFDGVVKETSALADFSSAPSPLRLRDVSSELDTFIPLSETIEVVDAVLTLNYANSIALLSERSTLIIRLNEATIAQVPLSAERPQGTAKIRLPQSLWRPGFNKLTLAVTQHYTNGCEDPEAPELWTEIDISSSNLEVTYKYSDIDYTLSNLSQLVAPGFGSFEKIRVATAAGGAPEVLEQAVPLAVQALALRRNYLPLKVETVELAKLGAFTPPQSDGVPNFERHDKFGLTVLVGTSHDLADQLGTDEQDRIVGPTLMLRGEMGQVELLITGRTVDEVVRAANNLALIDDHLNPSDFVSFSPEELAPIRGGLGRKLEADTGYEFVDLGVETQTIGGNEASEVVVPLNISSDFYTYEGAEGELFLNFNYTAGMGPGSIFGVSVNGEFIHGLSLSEQNGTSFRNYRIVVPGRLLRPGYNEITLGFDMRPVPSGGDCISVRGQNVTAQVVGDSQFHMPPGGSAMVLPDLSLLSESGMPFGALAIGTEPIDVYVSSSALYASALVLIGKIAQTSRVVEPNFRLKTGIPDQLMHNTLVVAAQNKVPSQLFGEWPVIVGETLRWPYSALAGLNVLGVQNQELTIDKLLPILLGEDQTGTSENKARLQTFRQRGDLGDLGVLAGFKNPWSEEFRTIVLLTAATEEAVEARVNTLVAPGVWGQIRGDFVTWDVNERVSATFVSKPQVVAPNEFWLRVRLILSQSPQLWLLSASGALMLFVLSATLLLRRRIRRLAESP